MHWSADTNDSRKDSQAISMPDETSHRKMANNYARKF